MPAGSNEGAATDILSPLDMTVPKIETTQLASSEIAIDAVDGALDEHRTGELAARVLAAPNLCHLARTNLQKSAASAIPRGDENLVAGNDWRGALTSYLVIHG